MAYVYKGTVHDLDAPPERDASTPGPKPRPFDPDKCGTRAGYKQHKRHDEDACQDCQDANNTYMADYNEARRKRRVLKPCGTRAAYVRHVKNGETPCVECTEANNEYQRSRRKDASGNTRLTLAPLNPAVCGTYAGYKAHTRRGQKACPPCSEARTEYYLAQKAAQQERRAA